jgi:hypothetical protein
MGPVTTIEINRAPVLALWASVVAERLGFARDEALSLGKALSGLNANTKAQALGLHGRSASRRTASRAGHKKRAEGETVYVELMGRAVPAQQTSDGLRAVNRDRVVTTESVERYLEGKFGEGLPAARRALQALARAHDAEELAECAFSLYEEFRPQIPRGKRGWGAKGTLDLELIKVLARA